MMEREESRAPKFQSEHLVSGIFGEGTEVGGGVSMRGSKSSTHC